MPEPSSGTPEAVTLRAAVKWLRSNPNAAGVSQPLADRLAWHLEQVADLRPTTVIPEPRAGARDRIIPCECGVSYPSVLLADLGCPVLTSAAAVAREAMKGGA